MLRGTKKLKKFVGLRCQAGELDLQKDCASGAGFGSGDWRSLGCFGSGLERVLRAGPIYCILFAF